MAGEFVFKENSKAMYDKVIASAPDHCRNFTQIGIDKGLTSKDCGEVTEGTHVFLVLDFHGDIIRFLLILRTAPSILMPECHLTHHSTHLKMHSQKLCIK